LKKVTSSEGKNGSTNWKRGRQEVSREEGDLQKDRRQEDDRQEDRRHEDRRQKDRRQEGDEAVVQSRTEHASPTPIDWVAKGWENFDYYTSKASEISRQLALLGFAAIVFLAGVGSDDFELDEVVELPDGLIVAGTLLAIGLMVDLLQYLVGSALWYAWPRVHEYRREKPAYVPPDRFPGWLPAVINTALIVKFACVAAGWTMLLVHIANAVR
jgi:hypothetical protein